MGEAAGALFASKNYADPHTFPTNEYELSGHKFIVFEGENTPQLLNNWLLDRIDKSQIAMKCSDMKSMYTAIEMGVGIGPMANKETLINDDIVRCFETPKETTNTLWLLINPAAYRRSEVKAFTAFFAPRYQELIPKKNR